MVDCTFIVHGQLFSVDELSTLPKTTKKYERILKAKQRAHVAYLERVRPYIGPEFCIYGALLSVDELQLPNY